jgi:membrane-associated phospholipid phosphatase
LRRCLAILVSLAIVSFAVRARAVEGDEPERGSVGFARGGGKPLTWDPAWREFDWFDAGLMGVAGTGTIIGLVIGPDTGTPNRGGVLFDESVRDALRLDDPAQRQFARDSSDFLLSTVTAYPYFIDSLLVASWYRRSPRIGMQMALIAAEAAVVTYSLQTAANVFTSRERPFGRECGDEVNPNSDDCIADNRFKSFLSGHTSQSFVAASVTCVFHIKMPLYGAGTDWIPCAGGLTAAAATGTLRIVADQHYATDVIGGAVLGMGVGFGLPLLLHFNGDTPPDQRATLAPRFFFVPTPNGAHAVGVF